jgi:hypothetical protein
MNENRSLAPRPSLERGHGNSLGSQASRWGTPTARQDHKSPEAARASKESFGRTAITSLRTQALTFPTPKSRDWRNDATQPSRSDPDLSAFLQDPLTARDGTTGVKRADLNPSFVATLMGLPPGWLTPWPSVATASFRRWLRWHSAPSSPGPGPKRRRRPEQPGLFGP